FLRPNPSLSCLSPLSLHDALPILRRHARPPARRTNLKHHSQRGSRERSGSTRSQSMSFESLGLLPELTRALSAQGYESPTAIQAEAIPLALAGHDLMGGAQTGTGKTAAFALPLLQRLADAGPRNGPRKPRALVLVPTRELAVQVNDSLKAY